MAANTWIRVCVSVKVNRKVIFSVTYIFIFLSSQNLFLLFLLYLFCCSKSSKLGFPLPVHIKLWVSIRLVYFLQHNGRNIYGRAVKRFYFSLRDFTLHLESTKCPQHSTQRGLHERESDSFETRHPNNNSLQYDEKFKRTTCSFANFSRRQVSLIISPQYPFLCHRIKSSGVSIKVKWDYL